MQRLVVNGAVRPLYGSLGVKGLSYSIISIYVQIQFIPHEKHKVFNLQKKNNRPGLCRGKTVVYYGNPA